MSQHKKRRERRFQVAAALVGDGQQIPVSADDIRSEDALLKEFAGAIGGEDMCGVPSDPLATGAAAHGGRSQQPSDDLSSCMFQPRWHRLLHALGENVSKRLDDSCASEVPDEAGRRLAMLTGKTDGVGGGTVEDVSKFLEGLLVKSHLNDSDVGFVLLHTCHHVQSGDLHWSSATWRSLLLVASLVAVREVCAAGGREEPARTQMLAYVAHWWSQSEVDVAQEAFVERRAYKQKPPSRSALAKLYFELRDQGLRLQVDQSSNASAVFLSDAFDSKQAPHSADFARPLGFGDDSGALSVSSLRISEDSSSFSSSAIPEEIFSKKTRDRQKKSIISL